MKNTILISIILILCLGSKSSNLSSLEINNTIIKQKLKECDYAYKENLKSLDSVIEVNRNWNNHVYRMQYIAGVTNPDTVFTWIEKVIHPIDTRKTLNFND